MANWLATLSQRIGEDESCNEDDKVPRFEYEGTNNCASRQTHRLVMSGTTRLVFRPCRVYMCIRVTRYVEEAAAYLIT
jgi:hypothetical protein